MKYVVGFAVTAHSRPVLPAPAPARPLHTTFTGFAVSRPEHSPVPLFTLCKVFSLNKPALTHYLF